LTASGRARREQVRLYAAALFDHDITPVQVAKTLRVSTKSACQWHRRWQAGGTAALASTGPCGNPCRLPPAQQTRLAAALDAGPAAYGWSEYQRWTLARIARLIGRLFHVSYTLRGTSYLLHRMGWSPQVPAHRAARCSSCSVRSGRAAHRGAPGRAVAVRAVERDKDKVAAWRTETWAKVRG